MDRDLNILNALAQALSHSPDLERSLGTALDRVAELLHLETGWVWLLDESTGESRLAAARNLPPGLATSPTAMQGSCYCLNTYRAGDLRGAANVNVVWCSRLASLVDGTNGLRCHASIPLYADERQLGILNVASRDWRELTDDELKLLYTIGALLSLAIERSRLMAKSAQLGALEERNRLAREIHDTLAQSLAAITMQLETADALAEGRHDRRQLASAVRRALELTRNTLEEARHSVLELRAAPLDGRTLAEAVGALTRELDGARDGAPKVQLSVDGDARTLPPGVEIGLYRIAREALSNVLRHARARTVRVELTVSPARARLRVADDGAGFVPQEVPRRRYGLIGMNERAKLLGGALRVDSALGQGTTIEVTVPLRGSA